jgi:DNA polymerase-3 subunit alpha
MKNLIDYILSNKIDAEISGKEMLFNNETYHIIDRDIQIIDDEEFNLSHSILSSFDEGDLIIFEFGGRFYTHTVGDEFGLNEFRHVGLAKQKLPTSTFLGVHSGYELMRSLGTYKKWVAKAKFLGVKSLAICENNTLAGALVFQKTCLNNDIKPIFGMEFNVSSGENEFSVKAYAKNFEGWQNLLKINDRINVGGEHILPIRNLSDNRSGLFIVADPKSMSYKDNKKLLDSEFFDYYQLDTVIFKSPDTDRDYFNNLELFLGSSLAPIAISDAMYVDKEDAPVRELIWSVGKKFYDPSDNQYFKSKDEYAIELIKMYEASDGSWIPLYKEAVKNEEFLADSCNFEYDTKTRHLPKYVMTEAEANKYKNKDELFMGIITDGFKKKKISNPELYVERLKEEIKVLRDGDVIDYFLSIHDILGHASSRGMLTGLGRGSAAGSLVSYLMDITRVDPIEFKLLFSRFLNSGRMGNLEDAPAFKITGADGEVVEIVEGTVVRILREEKEKVVFIHEVIEGDVILKY